MSNERTERIERCLRDALQPVDVHIVDDSAAHAGHEGAKSGGGHFDVTIVAEAFAGKTLLQRHRLVYEAVDKLLGMDIHALSIKALTPDEL